MVTRTSVAFASTPNAEGRFSSDSAQTWAQLRALTADFLREANTPFRVGAFTGAHPINLSLL